MSRVLSCPRGHRWQALTGSDGSRCPVCGAAAAGSPSGSLGLQSRTVALEGEAASPASSEDCTVIPPAERPGGAASEVRIAGYEILGELGRGGMGVVYMARQKSLNRLVALKMVLAGAHATPQELVRFRSEAEAVAQLHHPNIVQIYEIGEQDGWPYFSLEFVEGGSLAERLGGVPQPPRESASLVEVLARTIHWAHERGIVHRDLKPANVLLAVVAGPWPAASAPSPAARQSPADRFLSTDHWSLTTTPKITDFGLAKHLQSDTGATRTGAVLGTPSYIAPEQAAGRGKEIGPSADVYALGAILYEMLTGRPPFRGETALDTMLQVMSEEPVPPARLQPKVPRDLETICLKCLQKEPRKRYASARDLADDLHRFLHNEPIHARPTGLVERGWKWARRRPAAAALVAMVLLAVASAFVLGAWHNAELRQEARRTQEQADAARRALADAAQHPRAAARQQWLARKSEAEARQQAQLARQQLEHSRRSLYALQLTQVGALWQRDPRRGLELLDDESRCPPDLRDFTWSLLHRLCRRERGTLPGQGKPVSAIAFGPDGRTLVSASWDETARIWDVPAGQVRHLLKGHARMVLAVAVAPDGKTAATASEDSTIKLWETATGQLVATLTGHDNWVKGLAFSPDGRTLASASHDGTVKLWDPLRHELRQTLKGHQGPVLAVCFAPDGTLASAGQDRVVRLWDRAGQPAGALAGHTDVIHALAFAADGKLLASAGADRTIRLWDPSARVERDQLRGHLGPVWSLAFAPQTKLLASASSDGTVKLWQPASGEERSTFVTGQGTVLGVAFSPDGHTLASASGQADGTIKLWNVNPEAESATLPARTRPGPTLAFSPDGALLATALADQQVQALDDNKVKLWDSASGKGLRFLKRDPLLAFAPDGTLATGEPGGRITCWDPASGEERAMLPSRLDSPITCLAFNPDGRLLASGSDDGRVKLRHTATLEETASLSGHSGPVTALAFSPSGRVLLSASKDGSVRVWDVALREERAVLGGHAGAVLDVAWSPDGQTIASAGEDGVRLWEASSFRHRVTLRGHRQPVRTLAFSSDSKTLASAGDDASIRLWDAVTGQERAALAGHSRIIHALRFHPAQPLLASASADGTVKLWQASPAPRGE
jgi:WD40 repeat protein/serine/threonine protein kinase